MPFLPRKNPRKILVELNQLSESLYMRVSRNPCDLLEIQFDANQKYRITRRGYPKAPPVILRMRADVEKHLRKFYADVSFNGSGAPNDLFLDSLNQVTEKK